jgi:hypothetical protein
MRPGRSRHSAAPPPALAPNRPIGSVAISDRPPSQSMMVTSRPASISMSNRRMRSAAIDRLFLFGEKINQQCRESLLLQHPGDVLVARAVTAAPAAMGKRHRCGFESAYVGSLFERSALQEPCPDNGAFSLDEPTAAPRNIRPSAEFFVIPR